MLEDRKISRKGGRKRQEGFTEQKNEEKRKNRKDEWRVEQRGRKNIEEEGRRRKGRQIKKEEEIIGKMERCRMTVKMRKKRGMQRKAFYTRNGDNEENKEGSMKEVQGVENLDC